MDWVKEIGAQGGADGGWKNDFPLNHDLPERIGVDCSRLMLPIHPMFAVRLGVFVEWHRREGRDVEVILPADEQARRTIRALRADPVHRSDESDADAILPLTRLDDDRQAEDAARRTREILEYQLTDVSALGSLPSDAKGDSEWHSATS